MSRLDRAASAIAQMSGVEAVSPVAAGQSASRDDAMILAGPPSYPINIDEALVEAMDGALAYRANATVMGAADRMIGALLDKKA